MSKAESHPLIEPFLDALWLERGLSDNTVSSYRTDLEKFALWLDEQGGSLLLAGLDDIQHYLAWRVDHQFAASSTARFLSALRRFYQYLNREKLRSDDPTVLLEGPKLPKKLPSDLSEAEVEALLQAPLVDDPLELRDKAMLELLYATGLRVSELVGLTAEHVSLRQGLVRVVGKGNKERLVPMGEEAVHWLERYYREGRTLLLGGTSSDVVFPSKRARMMTRQTFWHRIKLYALRAGIRGNSPPHPASRLRHPLAQSRRRSASGADAAGPRGSLHHPDLYPRGQRAAQGTARPAPPQSLIASSALQQKTARRRFFQHTTGRKRLFPLLGFQQVADLGQQLLILGGAGRGSGFLFLLLLQGVDGLEPHEDGEGNDQEVDTGLDELAVGDDHGRGIPFGGLQGHGEIAEIHAPQDQPDGGHDHVSHEGGDNLAKGGTYDDTDRHVDHIAPGCKGLELLNQTHFSP